MEDVQVSRAFCRDEKGLQPILLSRNDLRRSSTHPLGAETFRRMALVVSRLRQINLIHCIIRVECWSASATDGCFAYDLAILRSPGREHVAESLVPYCC